MKMRRYVFLRAVTLIMILCIAVTSAVAEEAIAVVDPETGVLTDETGQPMEYSSLMDLLSASLGAGSSQQGRTLIDYGTTLNIAQFLPNGGTVSGWQIVARPYESSWQVVDDMAFRKSVSPTDVENEFEIVLEVCAPMSWEEFLKLQVYRQSQNTNPWHSKAGDVYLHDNMPPVQGLNWTGPAVIQLNGRTLFTTSWWLNSGMSGTGRMYYVGTPFSSGVEFFKGQFSAGVTVTFEIAPLAAQFSQSEHEVRAFTVTDEMGDYIVKGDDIYSADGTGDGQTAWTHHSIEYKSIPGLFGGKNSYMRCYTYSYKITLDTAKEGFEPDTPYYTNGTTTLAYSYDGQIRTATFDVPQVKGKLYDVELYKCDAEDPDQGVEGAEFELYHSDGTPYIRSGQDNPDTYITDEYGWITIEGLPYGSYYLKEVKAPQGYLMPSEADAVYGPFTLSYANLQSAGFEYHVDATNEKEPFGNLIVQKAVTGNGGDPDQTFLFHVTCTGETGTLNFEFSLHAGEAQTISAIPAPFSYVIQEDTEWSWRYTYQNADPGLSGMVDKGETETVTVSNHYSEQRWEGDVTDKQNIFGAAE